jgi:predicted aspartyl protease
MSTTEITKQGWTFTLGTFKSHAAIDGQTVALLVDGEWVGTASQLAHNNINAADLQVAVGTWNQDSKYTATVTSADGIEYKVQAGGATKFWAAVK